MHLISTISKKLICSKFPRLHFLKNENITQYSAYKQNPKKKLRCFDLKPDGPFSAVWAMDLLIIEYVDRKKVSAFLIFLFLKIGP